MNKPPASPAPSIDLLLSLLQPSSDSEEGEPRASGKSQGNRKGSSLRPGEDTPLWNRLREAANPYLRIHGEQARLGRMLGLHRQAVNAYFTRGSRMPDAERTLRIVAWLVSKSQSRAGGL